MSYFQEHYLQIRLPVVAEGEPGLRRGQRGAIHSIAAHFTLRQEPAVVVMPTGSGKTAVLMLSAYLLQANRVLVVTPSRLVRNQIANDFRTLHVLRDANAVDKRLPAPTVHEVEGLLSSEEAWRSLEAYDVVVGTPNSVSPAIKGVEEPPKELFDLVLVDEAHHSPAKTWNELMQAFPSAKRVLFTATPFRRDQLEIRGRFVYNYPIAEAYADGIFGQIEYLPVTPDAGEEGDAAIAQAAERIYKADQHSGLKHSLLVRTDTKKRAEELRKLYQEKTELRLELIYSKHSFRHIKQVINRLRSGALDGVICVNMLGEGFNFPNLKIAAIHAPHKSLAVTLQFIGRFARTSGENIGGAKFLAIPSDIEVQAKKIYEEGAVWQEIIPGLLDAQVQQEVQVRELLGTFRRDTVPDIDAVEGIEDLSLYSLRPYHHVKVFEVMGNVKLDDEVVLPEPFSVVFQEHSEEMCAAVVIAKETTKPRWASTTLFEQTKYDLFIIYFDEDTNLLFVCASRKTEVLYRQIVDQIVDGNALAIPASKTNKALLGLSDYEFYNIGMRNSIRGAETYRIMAGSNTQDAVTPNDGRNFHQGHTFGRALDGQEAITIGTSTLSKIWSNTSSLIPTLIEWCKQLAQRLNSDELVVTKSGLDYLYCGQVITSIPEGVIAADWHHSNYGKPKAVSYVDDNGEIKTCQLLELDLQVDRSLSNQTSIRVNVCGRGFVQPVDFSLQGPRHFTLSDGKDHRVKLIGRHSEVTLVEHLNGKHLNFYFADSSRLSGRDWFPSHPDGFQPFETAQIEAIPWVTEGVDVQKEFGSSGPKGISIHDYLERRLVKGNYDVIIYDHGSGEVADYLAIKQHGEEVHFELYHCKKSGAANSGDRVGDLYDVCGQGIKSLIWLKKNQYLLDHMRTRIQAQPSKFIVGDAAKLEGVIKSTRYRPSVYQVVLVQPSVSKANLSEKLANLLAAVDEYVRKARCQSLKVFGSD